MKLKDFLAPFAVWKRAFEKPYTVMNPIDERPGAERYRGFHKNDIEKCIGCGTCEAICQNAAIDMVPVSGIDTNKSDSGLRPRIDYGRCCWCALCVDICTTRSLTMSNEYIWVDSDPEVFRFIPGAEVKSWDSREQGYKPQEGYELLNKKRESISHIDEEQRLTSFLEMIRGYSKEQALKEADRCVACGICIAACPAHMDIPGYIKAVREDNIEEGLKLLYETNPFPAVCGRVCTHRCEEVCALGHTGEPIAIRWLKRYIADQIELGKYGDILSVPLPETGKNTAVLGAGPGGLSAAYYLRMMGHKVTVFEANPAPGGMLRYGIPEYRLPYDQLDKDVEYIRNIGVTIKYNTRIGENPSFSSLISGYDAIFVSPGLNQPYNLGIEGEDHPRVLSGLDVLADVTNGKTPNLGRTVAVIGGGNVAMDAARTARRFGSEVTILYRRREEDMPADEEEIIESKEEGISIITKAVPVKITDPGNGKVTFVWGHAKMVDQGEGKRPKPVLMEDRIEENTFDSVIAAVGQGADLTFLPGEEESGITVQRWKVQTQENGQSGNPKVFFGGDLRNPAKDAISAIADGHRSARGIDQFLKG